MNSDPENFESLRRLLALKRHEQPPPGYFNQFSSRVIAGIRAAEGHEPASAWAGWFARVSWWQRLIAALEAKPGVAGAFGAATCALLISGIVFSENAPAPVAQALTPTDSAASFMGAVSPMFASDTIDQSGFGSSSTNPLSPVSDSLFSQFQLPKAQPISLAIPVGN